MCSVDIMGLVEIGLGELCGRYMVRIQQVSSLVHTKVR